MKSPRPLAALCARFSLRDCVATGALLALSSIPLHATEISVGGGLLDSGLIGKYYANTSFAGDPVFERRDIRIDFDWGTQMKPGGSIRGYHVSQVPADNYSISWEGRIMARFSETYTIKAYADAVRVWVKPVGGNWGTAQINTFGGSEPTSYTAQTFDFPFNAGQAYDIKVEYREQTGTAMMRLLWASASTPEEVIQPTAFVAEKPPSATNLLADGGMTGTFWGEGYPSGVTPDSKGDGVFARDAEGWPAEDFLFIITPNDAATNPGTYLLSFNGTAEVWIHLYNGETFSSVDGTVDYGDRLNIGEGYDPATNTTEVLLHLPDNGATTPTPKFQYTDRDGDVSFGGGSAYGLYTGVTNLRLMRPLAKNSPTPHAKDVLFLDAAIHAMDRFVSYRWNDVNDNGNEFWSDRKNLRGISSIDTQNINDEYKILWCNRTGRDLWLQVPHRANDDYITKLAQLVRYGSDENYLPYTSAQADPYFPPLNPNLKVYLEYSNEAPWNTAGQYPQSGWIQNRAENFRQAWFNNPSSPEGQQWAILNYDGKFQTNEPTKGIGGMDAGKRFYALRLKQISDLFRAVWGDDAMPAPGKNDPRIRPNLTYQYDNISNTARDSLFFIDHYFNKTDPASTYAGTPRPVNYYYYGGGPATYYASDDRLGIVTGHPLNDSAVGGFEGTSVAPGVGDLAPAATPWSFEGVAGIHHQPNLVSTTVGNLGSSTKVVDSYTYRGFKFTVGADDIAVQQVGRYRLTGNNSKHSIEIYDAETNAKVGSSELNLADVTEGEVGYVLTGAKNFLASSKFFTHPWILQAGKTYYLVSNEANNGDAHYTSAVVTAPSGITINGTAKGWKDGSAWTWQVGSSADRAFGPVDMKFTAVKTVTPDGQITLGFLNMSKEDRADLMRSNLPEKASSQALFIAGTGAAEIDVTFTQPGTYAFIYHLAYPRDQMPWLDTSGDGNPANDQPANAPIFKLIDGGTQKNISPKDQQDVRPGDGTWSNEGYWMKPKSGYDFTSTAPFEITQADMGKTFKLRIETDNVSTDDVLLMDNFVLSSTAYMMAGTIPGSGGLAEGDPGVSGWESRVRNMYVYVQTFGLRATAYEGGWFPGGDANKMPIQFAASFFDPKVYQGEQNAMNALARAGMTVAADYTFDFAMPNYDLANADNYVRIQAWDTINDQLRAEPDNGLPINSTMSLTNVWWSNDGFSGSNSDRLLVEGETMEPGDWAAWNVITPTTGNYTLKVETLTGGAYELRVDDAPVLTGTSGTAAETANIYLTKGLHSVRLVALSGSFKLNAIYGATAGEPYGVSGLTGEPGNAKAVLRWNYYPTVVDGYNVYSRPITEADPNPVWTLRTTSPVATPGFTVGGLTNDTFYEFAVRAVVGGVETAWSNGILLQPRVEAPAVPVVSKVQIDLVSGSVLVDWKLPDGTLPVADADSVVIRYGIDPDNLTNSVTVPSGTEYTFTGINTSEPFFFKIDVTNSAGADTTPVYSAYENTMDFSGVAAGTSPVGWTDYRDPTTSSTVTTLLVTDPAAPTTDWPIPIVSPTGTPMLRVAGHSRNSTLNEDAAAKLQYYGVRTQMTWGGSNNYDYFGLNMLNSGPDSYVYAYVNATDDLWVHSRDGSANTWKKSIQLNPDANEAVNTRVIDSGEWWTLDVRAYPAADGSDRLDLHVRIADETGANRLPATLNGSNYGSIAGDVWILPNVPKPLNGARGTYGPYASIGANSSNPNSGHWFDSVRSFPLVSIEAANAAPVVESSSEDVSLVANETFSYTLQVSDSDNVVLTAVQIPVFLKFTDNGDGTATLTGTPGDGDIENWMIVLRASDGVNDPVDTVFVLSVGPAITTPTITANPVSQSVTEGDNVTFTVAANANGGTLSYQWKRGTTNVGTNSATLSLSNVTTADAGNYTAVVTNSAGSITSSAATLTVNDGTGPVAFLEVNGLISMEAENSTARIEGTGSAAGITWQEQSDGAASGGVYVKALPGTGGINTGEGSQGPRLDFDVKFSTAGTYTIYVRMRGPGGSDDSVRLGVDGTILTTGGVGVSTGNSWSWQSAAAVSSTFTVSDAGNRTINVWMREDGTEVDKVLVTMGTAPTGTGPEESARSGNSSVISPTITTQPSSQTVTAGANVSFSVTATNGGGMLDYQWKKDGANVSTDSATLSLSNVTTADAGSYTVVVTNSAGSITSSTATLTVNTPTPPPTGGGGGLRVLSGSFDRDYWTGLSGSAITNLTSSSSYPAAPSGFDTIVGRLEAVSWSGTVTTKNYDDNYGQKLLGYIVPETTGSYTFWLSSEDYSEFWLSTDELPANKFKTAWLYSWSQQYNYTSVNSNNGSQQKSAEVSLVAGNVYYFEVLHKEGTGGDHVSVAWSTDANITPTEANIVPASVLSNYEGGVPPLFENWTSQDIGSPGAAGSSSYDVATDTFTINGSGSDIWGSSDKFHYVTLYGGMSGDGEIIARVASQTNTNGWAKAGVMIRDGLVANAKFAMTVVTPSSGISFQRRVAASGGASSTTTTGAAPEWVKLTRVGDVFTAYRSEDGATWTQIGLPETITMGSDVQIGLCVTSHNNTVFSTVVMDNVTATP